MLIFAIICLAYGVVFMLAKDYQKSTVLFMVGSAAGWTAAIVELLG